MAAGDTGKISPGGRRDSSGESLIPCRFLWVYQIFKSRNASFCSFLLYSHAGLCILSVCSKYAKAAYAVLRTQRGCPVLLGFACDAHAHHFVMSSPFTSSVASAKEDGCTKILALLRAISRGFLFALFRGEKPF